MEIQNINCTKYISSILRMAFLLSLLSCKKEGIYEKVDYNRIPAIVADNPNLSLFTAALDRMGLDEFLQKEDGPFTVLVPSNDAFRAAGIPDGTALRSRTNTWLSHMTNYHILPGRYDLSRFPFLINQEVKSRVGKIFVSRWIKGQDTLLTINGARVLMKDLRASNGRIQIINRVLEPYIYDNLADALTSDSLTLFSEALRRANMMDMLKKDVYTILAPSNYAMSRMGYLSIQQVSKTDPQLLKELCSYHISQDRRFVNDFIISVGQSEVGTQRMINTLTVTIHLIRNPWIPGEYSGITLTAPGNTTEVKITRQDILAGNGVIHIVDNVFRKTR